MSNFEREIEIRFKLDDGILKKIRHLDFDSFEETDEYFFTKETFTNLGTYLRLRNKKGKILLNLKDVILHGKDSKDASEFKEVVTELNPEQYKGIKEIFNPIFPIKLRVRKIRKISKVNGCEICLDEVDGLGKFIEIEGPRKNILEICRDLNLKLENKLNMGYVEMLIRKGELNQKARN